MPQLDEAACVEAVVADTANEFERRDGDLVVSDPPDGQWSRPPRFPDGAGGLVSTAEDLLRFGRMLLLPGGNPVLTAGTVASAGLLEVSSLVSVIRDESAGHVIPGLKGALDDVPAGKPQTILVLGSDRRFVDIKQDNPARSDTMMLVRLDPSKEATAVMNIPRDLKVEIPEVGTDKFNAAYSYGGPKLALRVVKELTGLPINHVVNVDFLGFVRAVDVQVEVAGRAELHGADTGRRELSSAALGARDDGAESVREWY